MVTNLAWAGWLRQIFGALVHTSATLNYCQRVPTLNWNTVTL